MHKYQGILKICLKPKHRFFNQFKFSNLEENIEENVVENQQVEQDEDDQILIKNEITFENSRFKTQSIKDLENSLQNFEEKSPLNIFDTLFAKKDQKRNEDIMKSVQSMDPEKFIKSRLSYILKNMSENNYEESAQKIEQLVDQAFQKQIYRFMNDIDFKQIIFQKEFLHIIGVFMSEKFFISNPQFIQNAEVLPIINKYLADTQNAPLLELLKYHRSFVSAKQQYDIKFKYPELIENVIEKSITDANVDHLQVFFHLYQITKTNIFKNVNTEKLMEKFESLYFGNQTDKKSVEIFRNKINELLNLKLKVQFNKPFQFFFLDSFLQQSSYDMAMLQITQSILILARLAEKQNNLNDVFQLYEKTFGKQQFELCILNWLPKVFQTFTNKRYIKNLDEAILEYQKNQENKEFILQSITYFDKQYKHKHCYLMTGQLKKENYVFNGESKNKPHISLQKIIEDYKPQNMPANVKDQIRQAFLYQNYKPQLVQLLKDEFSKDDDLKAITTINQLSSKNDDEFLQKMLDSVQEDFLKIIEQNQLSYGDKKEDSSSQMKYVEQKATKKFYSVKHIQQRKKSKNQNLALQQLPFQSLYEQTSSMRRPFSTIKRQFSSSKFNEFMDGIRQIDTMHQINEQEQEDQLSIQKKPSSFLSKDELRKMKNQLEAKTTNKTVDLKFESISNDKEDISQSSYKDQFTINNDYWDTLLQKSFTNVEIREKIEKHFLYLQTEPLWKSQSILEHFLLQNTDKIKGQQDFIEVFLTPKYNQSQTQLQPVDHFKIQQKNNAGEQISKDYNKYLKESVFHYSLGDQAYTVLLNWQKKSFNKKYYKKIMTHMIRFNRSISDELLELSLSVAKEQKLGQSLLEMGYIMPNIKEHSIPIMVNSIQGFKTINQEIDNLIIFYLENQENLIFKLQLVEPYVQKLIKYNQSEKYMLIFEKFKEFLLARKARLQPNLTVEEIVSVNEAFKIKMLEQLHQFYTDFISKLNENNIRLFAKLTFQDMCYLKYKLNQRDYNNGLIAFSDEFGQMKELFNEMEQNQIEVNKYTIQILLKSIQQNPKDMEEFYEGIMQKYIFSLKLELDIDLINQIILTFSRINKSTLYGEFLRFLGKNKYQLKNQTKMLCYKVLSVSSDDVSKSYLKGLIDNLFSEETQTIVKQNQKKKIKKDQKNDDQLIQPVQQEDKEQLEQKQEVSKRLLAKQSKYVDDILKSNDTRKQIKKTFFKKNVLITNYLKGIEEEEPAKK